MKRRHLLKYGSLSLAGLGLSACEQANLTFPQFKSAKKPDFDLPEKTSLRIAYVPTLSALPLIIAQEKGIFETYGLTVSLVKQVSWAGIEKNLREWQVDAAHSLFALPLHAQLSANYSPIISLMMLNLNGSAITLTPKAWQAGLRPSQQFINFEDFSYSFRKYFRQTDQKRNFAVSSPYSFENYLMRYWLGAMGIDAQRDINWLTFPPQQMIYKLQAGMIDGFGEAEPWNQQTVSQNAGFIPYTYRDIWQGHPGAILATLSPWVEKHPNTSKALIAAMLKSCQFCEDPKNQAEIAQIVGQPSYFNLDASLLEPLLRGQYTYQTLESASEQQTIADFNIYHYQPTDYLQAPNHANYQWRSHAVWLLTQMVRWQQLGLKNYPKNADYVIERAYPVALYEEVAQGLEIELPSDRNKVEPPTVFIDHREFDPSQPDTYLKQFELRANRPQWLS
ncbi:MAG: CmpA/NrtA family ABC transporter substrate-binding protein [Microcystaceae cyanobacterium]